MSKSLEKRIEEAIDTSLEDTSTSLGERRKLKRNILKQVRQDRKEEEEEGNTDADRDLTRRKFLKMLGIGTGGLALSSSAAGLFKITDQPQTSTINADTVDNFDIQKNGSDTNGVINLDTNSNRITVDGALIVSGTPPIPDSESLHARYDFREYNSTATSGFEDLTGNGHDLINGSITDVSESINGQQAGNFDGSNDSVYSDSFSDIAPATIAGVARPDHTDIAIRTIFEGVDNDTTRAAVGHLGVGGNPAGIANNNNLILGTGDVSLSIYIGILSDTDGFFEQRTTDNQYTKSGASGSRPIERVEVGGHDERGGDYWHGAIGEMLIYPDIRTSSQIDDIRAYLNEEWGIF
jgi:hypothetical protein